MTIGPLHGAIAITRAYVSASVHRNEGKLGGNVPVGFTPDEKPNWGMRASFTSLRVIGIDDTVDAKRPKQTRLQRNFIPQIVGRNDGISDLSVSR